ncbi:MAG: VWA domain-containing protein [Nannocystaceae bacterium]
MLRQNQPTISAAALCGLLGLASACSVSGGKALDASDTAGGGGQGVGQGGAQDFGQFKQILEDGEIPGPETLDDVGFFGEHKIELPAPECGQSVCLGLFGQMGHVINGSVTTLLLGMNTPIPIPPTRATAPSTSLSPSTSPSSMQRRLDLRPRGAHPDARRPRTPATRSRSSPSARRRPRSPSSSPAATPPSPGRSTPSEPAAAPASTGLRTAMELIEGSMESTQQNRVILLSDGVATEGITSDAKILEMATAYTALGIGLTTIGIGTDFDTELMRSLSEGGSGAFYFLEDPQAVQEVFVEEVTSS